MMKLGLSGNFIEAYSFSTIFFVVPKIIIIFAPKIKACDFLGNK